MALSGYLWPRQPHNILGSRSERDKPLGRYQGSLVSGLRRLTGHRGAAQKARRVEGDLAAHHADRTDRRDRHAVDPDLETAGIAGNQGQPLPGGHEIGVAGTQYARQQKRVLVVPDLDPAILERAQDDPGALGALSVDARGAVGGDYRLQCRRWRGNDGRLLDQRRSHRRAQSPPR